MGHGPRKVPPRADNVRIYSSEERSNVHQLLREYGEVPIYSLTLLYKAKFHKVLDCLSMKTDGGLLGYLQSLLGNMIEIANREGNLHVMLSDSSSSSGSDDKESNIRTIHMLKKQNFERACAPFFNSKSILWRGIENWIDRREDIIIDLSPIEQAIQMNRDLVQNQILRIRRILAKFPDGLPLNEIVNYVSIDLKLLHATDINTLTVNSPEIFYRVERPGREPLIFDGHIHTYPDLSGNDDKLFGRIKPEDIVKEVMRNHVYQRTLILMRDKGPSGLKINTWSRSMERSFYQDRPEQARNDEIYKYGPLVYFMALARFGLVVVSSEKDTRNDLRAYIPRNKTINYEQKFETYLKLESNNVN